MPNRKNLCFALAAVLTIHSLFIFAKNKPANSTSSVSANAYDVCDGIEKNEKPANSTADIYETLHLQQLGLSIEAFTQGVEGYNSLLVSGRLANSNVLSIIDFSKPSASKRLFVIDMKNGKLLFNTYVAHGRNSGREMAKEFSNDAESNKSSLGFFLTGDTYLGKHGFSLRLLGEEKGINDNANSRAIVMHSAAYVSEEAIRMQGFAGRSLGCPALPEALNKPIIEKIKNGSCLFLYSPDRYYASHSVILKKMA